MEKGKTLGAAHLIKIACKSYLFPDFLQLKALGAFFKNYQGWCVDANEILGVTVMVQPAKTETPFEILDPQVDTSKETSIILSSSKKGDGNWQVDTMSLSRAPQILKSDLEQQGSGERPKESIPQAGTQGRIAANLKV